MVDLVDDLVITGVENQSKIITPPDSNDLLNINLSVVGSQSDVIWIVNGRKVGETEPEKSIDLKDLAQGKYVVMAYNRDGQMGMVEFEVL